MKLEKLDAVPVYIQLGEEMISLGALAFDRIRALFQTGEADDDATLARIDAEYATRIARAQANADGAP
jgi:hypothetical protein